MATRPTMSQARQFALLIAELSPEVHRAFMASVTDLQGNVDWRSLLDALERMDTPAAIAALHIDPAAWATYSAVVSEVYAKAAASTIAQIQAQGIAGIGVRFRMTDPSAQEWIRENVANRVVGFSTEQIQVARTVIEAGYAQGQGPRNIATDLVGRATGGTAREGGVLGLDGPRAARLQAVTHGMRTAEGVRDLVIEHADGTVSVRYRVNEATAKRILRAFRSGAEVPAAERVISERQYKNALLKDRADTVANTEVANAVMSGRQEQWRQLVETRGLDPNAVKKTWRHRRGSKDGRIEHIAISGKSVQGLFTPFVMGNGARMMHPHDVAGGAKHNVNCGCDCTYEIDPTIGLL